MFFSILLSNIIPIFLIVLTGILIQKKYQFEVKVFSKLLFVVFIPVLVFKSLYGINIAYRLIGDTILFLMIFTGVLMVLSYLFVKARHLNNRRASTVTNSIVFYNCANFGLPLIMLVFPDDSQALSIQVIVVMVQTLLMFTFGIATANAGLLSKKEFFSELSKVPVIYAIILAVIIRLTGITIPEPLLTPINYISNGYVPVALLVLGFQLAMIDWKIKINQVLFTNLMRLALAPVLAFLIVWILGISGTMAQVLIISSAVPTAVNVVMLAIEYDNEPEFSSQVVLSSTILSAISLPIIISIVKTMI
ncbi:AEC family transporter [Thalassobacillus pellis]|uniref:AEC family transporter n=1 Tax=Thalassobacillus pellis TaxID=748008 RepID=UPI001EF94838|nr:AEC family transporter [Thalassobacillus pellis]